MCDPHHIGVKRLVNIIINCFHAQLFIATSTLPVYFAARFVITEDGFRAKTRRVHITPS